MKSYISCYFLCDNLCDNLVTSGVTTFLVTTVKNILQEVVTGLSQGLSQALSLMIQGFYLFCDKCDKKNPNLAKNVILAQNVSDYDAKTRISLYTRVRARGCHTKPQNNNDVIATVGG